ncbi:T-cell activation Rho GTPase-activating protein-like [Haliaeetus albicilla]|uniref:T-cell activation Rho GTPase-activating protein-like n=1 Tax=Haliaeetus albicilla TaxID=8969 RepID=UPI0037E8D014
MEGGSVPRCHSGSVEGSSQARATDSPIYQSWGTLPLTRCGTPREDVTWTSKDTRWAAATGCGSEMLAVLHKEGPSTEGIFRRAAGGTEFRELREALDHGADVDLGSQPALLLAVILKDFLRSIPAKLLVTDLYEDWMAAMQKSGKEEKVEELKA